MKARKWIVPAITGAFCLAAGFLLAERDPSTGGLVLAAGPAPAHPVAADLSFTLEDVRQVVREELASRESSPDPGTAAASPGPDKQLQSPPATPEQTAAAVEASAVLDSAIARRAWTEADAERFSEHFEQLPADQRMELLRKFSVAVNQGRLVPQTDRMPF